MTEAETSSPPGESEHVPDDAPEVSVRAVVVLLLYFRREYGEERLRQAWQRHGLGLSLEYVSTMTNFMSLRFLERLAEALIAESGDPVFPRKSGLLASTPEALGFLYHLVRTFGTPEQCYRKMVELFPTLNRVGSFTIESVANNRMTLSYVSSKRERNRNICEGRMAQFSSVPMIWGLPPAQVREEQCQVRGGECCRYKIEWHNPVRGWLAWVGLLGGVSMGTAMGLLGAGSLPVLVPTMALGAASFGAWMEARREIRRKDEFLASQNEGLMHSLRDLELRYHEVFRSNMALEDRVAGRTRELTEANVKLEASLAKQKELDRLKSEFFDNVSHELRTPLTLILLTLESLLQRNAESLPTHARQHLQTMERSAQRLLRLINNLLDLAQMESGKARLRYQPLELHGFLTSLLLPFKVMADHKGVALRLEGHAAASIHVDVERIDGVFQNLVSNALRFTQVGSVTVRIFEDDSWVHVEVADTGPGISAQDIPVIFDRFAQADVNGMRRFGGTGIGLALVKETLELHAGGIRVHSEVGRGSTFQVRLPKGTGHIREDLRERRAADMPTRRDRRSGSFPALGAQGQAPAAPRPAPAPEVDVPQGPTAPPDAPRILLVEDDAEIRGFIAGILQIEYRVLEAENGQEGLQRAVKERPDLILSDVMMPVMSGLQMLAALRSSQETADIPVILLTARHEVSATVEGFGAGANDYLGKPFSPREVLARIEAQLRLREAAVRAAENERLAATGLLTSGFAHEVRNPLNGLMNALMPLRDSLQGGQVDTAVAGAMLDVVEECGQRIRHLAESLLSFVRNTEKPVAVHLGPLLDSTLHMLEWRVPSGVKVERDYQCADTVFADPGSLNQVWVNLLDNALRAVGDSGLVRVATRRAGDMAVVTISDSGVGIRKEDMDRLFQPFFSTRAAGEGTGLGLALCRRIILRHGGRIELESEVGKGTRVEVHLPLRGAEGTVAHAPADERARRSA
ncbi:ATP-binding protein [Myxococcaceae bacterium GXIMD 01537]